MKTCEVVRDLMPLYVAKEASAESAALIGEHSKSCKSCKEYYKCCKSVAHPNLGIEGKKRYRYSALVKKIEMARLKEAAVVAAITSVTVGTIVYACLRGKK